jgi:hypothetical protein
MEKNYVLFAFNGDPVCFVHVMLNAFDLRERGFGVKVVLEGSAVTVVRELNRPDAPFAGLWKKFRDSGLIDVVCRACSAKLGVTEDVEAQGLPLGGDMNGHPAMSGYIEEGYSLITF